MRKPPMYVRHVLLACGVAGSLAFGAAQALAAPSAVRAIDACYNYPDPDYRCNRLCRASGGDYGFCDTEDGFCICGM